MIIKSVSVHPLKVHQDEDLIFWRVGGMSSENLQSTSISTNWNIVYILPTGAAEDS